jgi:hypothetical protein
MPGNRRESPERLSDDAHAKVTCPTLGTRMSRMQMALVLDDKLERRELSHQPIAQALCSLAHGGAVSDSTGPGRSLPLSQSTCGIMNTTSAALMPKTLNLTHTSSS